MSETARVRSSDQEVEMQVQEQLKVWFKLNQEKIIRNKVTDVSRRLYQSEHLQVSEEGVRGSCYVIARVTED